MTDSFSFKKPSDNAFTNIPKGSKAKVDALFDKDSIAIPKFQTLLNYWSLKKEEKALPSRKDMSPRDLVSVLPHIFIFDLVVKDGILEDALVSLMGTALVDLYGETMGESVNKN